MLYLKPNFIMRIFLLIIVCICGLQSRAEEFKVIGYLPSYRLSAVSSIDYKPLTHVMLSFANPDVNGNFSFNGNYNALRDSCIANDIELFISIGGGGLSGNPIEDYYIDHTSNAKRTDFIHGLMDFTRQNGFKGIDVDLEGNLVQMSTYEDFVLELRDSLHAEGLLISSAKAKWTTQAYLSNAVLNALDFINLMAYDYSGPWTYNNPGPHSSFEDAKADYNYYANTRNIDDSKLILGLPFYGYQFQPNASSSQDVSAKTWNQIVGLYPNNLNDDVVSNQFGDLYYNGKTTIANKVNWAKEQGAGGVMIWELGQDHFGEHSLLRVIDESIRGVLSSASSTLEDAFSIFPNPTNGIVYFDGKAPESIQVFDLSGKLLVEEQNASSIDLSAVPEGIYLVQIHVNNKVTTQKIIRK